MQTAISAYRKRREAFSCLLGDDEHLTISTCIWCGPWWTLHTNHPTPEPPTGLAQDTTLY